MATIFVSSQTDAAATYCRSYRSLRRTSSSVWSGSAWIWGEAGDTRRDLHPSGIVGNLANEHVDDFGAFGTGADQCHLAAQHVEELR